MVIKGVSAPAAPRRAEARTGPTTGVPALLGVAVMVAIGVFAVALQVLAAFSGQVEETLAVAPGVGTLHGLGAPWGQVVVVFQPVVAETLRGRPDGFAFQALAVQEGFEDLFVLVLLQSLFVLSECLRTEKRPVSHDLIILDVSLDVPSGLAAELVPFDHDTIRIARDYNVSGGGEYQQVAR